MKDGCIECGVDEVGRGSIAGPVVAAAVIWNPDVKCEYIKDSKKLSPKKRREMADVIKGNAVAWAVAFVDNHRIDEHNILQATYMAMHDCIQQVSTEHSVDHILVDGNRFKSYPGIPHTCVVKGDDKYMSIAAASILAKVAHDKYMLELSKRPDLTVYKWDQNMGYGTTAHVQAIQQHGYSEYHRRSFKLRKFVENTQ